MFIICLLFFVEANVQASMFNCTDAVQLFNLESVHQNKLSLMSGVHSYCNQLRPQIIDSLMIYDLGMFSRATCNKFPGIKAGGSKVCKHSAMIYVEEMFFFFQRFSHETHAILMGTIEK